MVQSWCNIARAIPTRVGKSVRRIFRPLRMSGHPHAGGEIPSPTLSPAGTIGPSPRGWGNLAETDDGRVTTRAIPTRVGKSRQSRHYSEDHAGHPHAGGEIFLDGESDCWLDGPSPRGWGNRGGQSLRIVLRRAIPTRVGKSISSPLAAPFSSGHPHAGGEIMQKKHADFVPIGPSPRGWGNLSFERSEVNRWRAIPTRVGKSAFRADKTRPRPGHPHAGGEIVGKFHRNSMGCGPSPRGWGNLRMLKS